MIPITPAEQTVPDPEYTYLVVVSPPDEIRAVVSKIKQDMDIIAPIGERNLNSIPHITLTGRLTNQPELIETVRYFVSGMPPFPINVTGIDILDLGAAKTIYLKVEANEHFDKLADALHTKAIVPCITLAKNIDAETANKLQPELSQHSYETEWLCTEITILRKRISDTEKGWREKFTISLQPSSPVL